ncbi:3-deoxy-D-manno-octulosonate 8-phosphate phosphatase [Mucinivorans hirudinis]|uniref:3-deoxy-D-manno-octulosonate 8-phosphate phosphatase n=1 Tax=Mucinivorans hirudinis TaxID=1433126 RepID=A0A060RBU6_9BACT|nr:3-deoxy-D-manno-octulosonate 8-phosphate phosphatase [Mucinivorans hirudinis]
MANFKEELEKIQAFVFDVDGVFTDCTIDIDAEGELYRRFNVRDGLAVVRAIEKGYPIAIISGSRGKQLQRRMESLGIRYIYLEKMSKTESVRNFSERAGVPLENILYMGDDYPDIEPMRMVGLSVAPADAADDVRAIARYVSKFTGGAGCVRDAIEQVLRVHNHWFVY